MKNFVKVALPTYDLHKELMDMIKDEKICYYDMKMGRQICLNTTDDGPDDFRHGHGSLTHDWDSSYFETDDDGVVHQRVPLFKVPKKEEDFIKLVSLFKGTLFEEVYNTLDNLYMLGRVRLMTSEPKTCLSWHVDTSKRLHYPLTTDVGCQMVIEDEVLHMPKYEWWMTDTTKPHTAFNAAKLDRIHLVAVIFGEK